MPRIQFATESWVARSLPVSCERSVNFYAEKEPPDAKTPIAVFPSPGILAWLTLGTGPIRGFNVMNNVLYVVSGQQLFSVTGTKQVTLLGGGINGSAVVSLSNNGIQVIVVNGVGGWVWNADTLVYQQITDPNFFPANTVTFFDEYFVLDKAGTNEFFLSNILDGTTYNALNFAAATVHPGLLLATVNQQENLELFCQNDIETWYDSGAVAFPFARYDGATVERGCAAVGTPIKEDNAIFFLGNDLIFYRLDGVLPKRVSTHAQEGAWQNYETVSDAFCFSFTFQGHKFVCITFVSANATWIFDIATNLWHERISYNSQGTSLGRWRVNCTAVFFNQNLVGDAFGNAIGLLSSESYQEYGVQMIGTLVSPPVQSDRKRVFHNLLELDMETGVGLASGQGSNPQVMLDWSNDGGRTWSMLQIWQSLGKVGEYLTRLRWKKMGQARQRVYRLTISDPVPRTLIAAHLDSAVGM